MTSPTFLFWIDTITGEFNMVEFDVVSKQDHEALMAITEHPVEEGVDVVDNARPKPRTLALTAFVSNKPMPSNPNVGEVWTKTSLDIPIPQDYGRPGSVALDLPSPPIALNLAGLATAGVKALRNAIGGIFAMGGDVATLAAPEVPTASFYNNQLSATVAAPGGQGARAYGIYQQLLAAQKSRSIITISTTFGELENMMLAKVSVPRTAATGNGAEFELSLTQVRIVKSVTVAAPLPAEARNVKPTSAGSQNAVEDDPSKGARKSSAATKLSGFGVGSGTP